DRTADLDWAVKRLLVGAFTYAGQVCISVQRLFVHDEVWTPLMERLADGARGLRTRDPLDPETGLGPMVDEAQAQRTQRWVEEAVDLGGQVITGGRADGAFFPATILADVPPQAQVCSAEAFAPVAVAFRFTDFDKAIRSVNDSDYGLQTGVFTNDLAHARRAFEAPEV